MRITIEIDTVDELFALRAFLLGGDPDAALLETLRVGLKHDTDALVTARETVEAATPTPTKE